MVSSPSQTRLRLSMPSRSWLTLKLCRYSQSFSATHITRSSLSATNGSGNLPSASRSVCTPPGTIAGDHSCVPHWRNCHSPFKLCIFIVVPLCQVLLMVKQRILALSVPIDPYCGPGSIGHPQYLLQA